MRLRTSFRAAAMGLAAALLAACGSTGGGSPEAPAASRDDAPSSSAPDQRPAAPAVKMKAGWMSYRSATRAGQVTTLTLLSASTEEGKLIQRGRARMEGGKVVDDETAALLLQSFEQAGFDRFAVRRPPMEPPAGAVGSVWLDRGNGFESVFLMPGARHNAETRDLPDVYDGLKKLILTVHQSSPGSMVVTGEGWSGDSIMNQQPGKKDR